MTKVTLPVDLEQTLRQRSAALGRPANELIVEALQSYLAQPVAPGASAYELGKDLFGRHDGPVDLSTRRKQALVGLTGDALLPPLKPPSALRGIARGLSSTSIESEPDRPL